MNVIDLLRANPVKRPKQTIALETLTSLHLSFLPPAPAEDLNLKRYLRHVVLLFKQAQLIPKG